MENELKIAADQIAQRFLISQLYMHKFATDPEAREFMPVALLTLTQRDVEKAAQQGGIESKLMEQVHLSVSEFLQDVEARLGDMRF